MRTRRKELNGMSWRGNISEVEVDGRHFGRKETNGMEGRKARTGTVAMERKKKLFEGMKKRNIKEKPMFGVNIKGRGNSN